MAELFKSGEEFPQVKGTPFWRQKMKTLFRRMDTNNDGVLTIEDFQAQAQRIIEKQGFSGEKANEIQKWRESIFYNMAQGNVQCKIEEFEFVEKSLVNLNSQGFRKFVAQDIKKWFNAFDLDHDELMSKTEHEIYFDFLQASSKDSAETFRIIDHNHDGWLTLDEFTHGFLIFMFSEDPNLPENNFFGKIVGE